MNFKEQVATDNKKVFINPQEFSDKHIINGKKMLCIIDNDGLAERRKKNRNRSSFYTEKISIKEFLIYVKAEDFGILPYIGRQIIFDNDQYTITEAVNEDGIYCLTMEANKL